MVTQRSVRSAAGEMCKVRSHVQRLLNVKRLSLSQTLLQKTLNEAIVYVAANNTFNIPAKHDAFFTDKE